MSMLLRASRGQPVDGLAVLVVRDVVFLDDAAERVVHVREDRVHPGVLGRRRERCNNWGSS